MGYGVKQSYYIASSWYQEAVDNKSVPAAYSLGSMYRRGKGIPQNDYYAFELFTKAATDYKRPNAYAQFELGQMYKEGSGTTIDEEKSKEWYQSAYEGFLELEINNSRAFISSEIISLYSELSKNAETFFVDAEKHNLCWDDSKEDHIRKTELRDVAYESRKKFEENWIKASEQVKKYLRAEE